MMRRVDVIATDHRRLPLNKTADRTRREGGVRTRVSWGRELRGEVEWFNGLQGAGQQTGLRKALAPVGWLGVGRRHSQLAHIVT